MRLKVYVADPRTGEMMEDKKPAMSVQGKTVDRCIEAARELLSARQYPPVRSINAGADDTLLVYCARHEQGVEATDTTRGLKFKRPSKYVR